MQKDNFESILVISVLQYEAINKYLFSKRWSEPVHQLQVILVFMLQVTYK